MTALESFLVDLISSASHNNGRRRCTPKLVIDNAGGSLLHHHHTNSRKRPVSPLSPVHEEGKERAPLTMIRHDYPLDGINRWDIGSNVTPVETPMMMTATATTPRRKEKSAVVEALVMAELITKSTTTASLLSPSSLKRNPDTGSSRWETSCCVQHGSTRGDSSAIPLTVPTRRKALYRLRSSSSSSSTITSTTTTDAHLSKTRRTNSSSDLRSLRRQLSQHGASCSKLGGSCSLITSFAGNASLPTSLRSLPY